MLILTIAIAITACGDESTEDESTAAEEPAATGSSGDSDESSPPPGATNQAPLIGGEPNRYAMVGHSYAFTPQASDAEGDSLSFRGINLPRWASLSTKTGRLYGTPGEGDVGRFSNIDIEVTDGNSMSRLGRFAIDVLAVGSGSIALSWIPATERVDGSPLTNLDGHRIHWGTEPGNYTESTFIEGAGITAFVIDGLLADTYYVAATTLDANGLESALSNSVSVTVN